MGGREGLERGALTERWEKIEVKRYDVGRKRKYKEALGKERVSRGRRKGSRREGGGREGGGEGE